jgi:hypothetical protein
MAKAFTETLLFASVAINAALLIFFASVYRRMTNAMDEAAFKNTTVLLVYYSTKSPFMIIALNLPLLGAIPYYYFYGFGNWWITMGLGLWLVAGSVAKMMKLPVYKELSAQQTMDVAQLQEMRHKLNVWNIFQAVCYSLATVAMALGCL